MIMTGATFRTLTASRQLSAFDAVKGAIHLKRKCNIPGRIGNSTKVKAKSASAAIARKRSVCNLNAPSVFHR